jgi:sialic acid synthase SpsE
MKTVQIADFSVAPDENVLVIAEIGVNHDGDAERAMRLVAMAADCGADAVKLQIFNAKTLMHETSAFAAYQKSAVAEKTPAEMLRRFELAPADLEKVVAEIRRLNMIPLATPFSPADVSQIESLNLPAIKIASPDIVNWPLLHRAAQAGKPLILSCGAADETEIATTASWLREWNTSFALLHCISSYPTPAPAVNLCWINELTAKFDVPCGFSDHTTEVVAGAMAVAAGACIIEKHITYDRSAAGPDHAASFDAIQFAKYVQLLRHARTLRGKSGKRVLNIEQDVRTVSRQSLVAARDIAAGATLQAEDLTVQRPGTGIPASAMPAIVGRRASSTIKSGQMLTWQFISNAAA